MKFERFKTDGEIDQEKRIKLQLKAQESVNQAKRKKADELFQEFNKENREKRPQEPTQLDVKSIKKEEVMPLFKKETEIDGSRIIIHRLSDGINVEIVGGDDVDGVAQKIATSFGVDLEIPDHPGTSHIRLVEIKTRNNDVEQFVTEMEEKGLL